MAITTNGLQLARIAGAVFNQQLSNADYTEILAANKTATELNAWANSAVASEFRNKTTTQVAEALLANVGLSTVAGLQNWVVGQLNAGGGMTKAGETILAMLNDFSNMSTADATYGAAVTTFNQKSSNSQAISQTAGAQTGAYATVSSSAPSALISLTSSVDNRTGGSGSDTFSAISDGTTVTSTTINAGDSLDGGAGTDTLSLTLMGAATAIGGVTTNGVEKIQIQTVQTGASSYDALLSTGLTEVTAIGSSQALTVSNLASIPVLNVSQNNAGVTLGYRSTAVTLGTSDSQTINLNGNASSSALTITSNGIENVTINSTGAASGATARQVTLADSSLQKLTVNASAALTATATLSGATSSAKNGEVDASASTANVALTITAGTNASTSVTGGSGNDTFALTPGSGNYSVTGGAGNDTVRIDGSTLTNKTIIAGGEGIDTLQLTVAANIGSVANGVGISGIETVTGFRSLAAAAGAAVTSLVVAQDMSNLPATSQPTTVGVTAWSESSDTASTPANGVNFTNLTAATTDLSLSGISFTNAAAAAANVAHTAGFTATAALQTNTTNDSLNVNLGTATAKATSTTVTNTGGGATAINLNVTVDNYENVTINSNGLAGDTNTIASLAASELKVLTIGAGAAALTVSASGAALSNLTTINASAATTDTNLNGLTMGTARGVTVTGGSGNDSYKGTSTSDNIDGGTGNDSIVGSGGNDVLTGAAGNDTLTGGSGNDVITGGDGDDSITGSTGNDNLSGGTGNDTFIVSVTGANTMGLSSTVTVSGGDGTDAIRLTGTTTGGAVALNFSPSTETRFTNTSVEVIEIGSLQNAAAEQTVGIQLGDIAMGNFANTVTIRTQAGVTGGVQTVDSSGILNTSSRVNYTGQAGVANTYLVGNNVDNVTLGGLGDTVTVSNALFLQATDTINGGLGADSLTVTAGATSVALTTSTLANVSSFETLTANFAAASLGGLSFTLSDVFASNNKDAATNSLTIGTTEGGGTGALTVTGTAVTGTNLIINSSGRADALTGGAGNDIFVFAASTSNSGESVTGGDGTDVLRFAGANSLNGVTLTTIEGIQFGVPGAATAAVTLSANASTLNGVALTVAEMGTTDRVNVIAVTANGLSTIDLSKITSAANAADGSLNALGTTTTSTVGVVTSTADQVTISFAGDADKLLAHTYTGSGLSDQITNAANTVSDTLIGGAGNDNFIYSSDAGGAPSIANIIANSAFIDSISGGSGTTDTITIDGTVLVTIANSISWTNVNTVETLAFTGATTGVISVTPAATAWAAGLRNITYAGDSSATGTNVIDASSNTTTTIGLTLIGASGLDVITGGAGNDSLFGGAGADNLSGGTGIDTISGGASLTAADSLAGGGGNDIFVMATRTEVLGSMATGDTTARLMDFISDFVVADDRIQFGIGANAFGTALTFTAATTATITPITVGDVTIATLGATHLAVAMPSVGGVAAAVASTAAAAQFYLITFGTITTGSALSGRTFLVLNDDTATLLMTAAGDTWIDVTGVTGTIAAANIFFG